MEETGVPRKNPPQVTDKLYNVVSSTPHHRRYLTSKSLGSHLFPLALPPFINHDYSKRYCTYLYFHLFWPFWPVNESKWISGFSELTQKLTGLEQKYIHVTQFDDVTDISRLSDILVLNCPFVSHLSHKSKISVCRGPGVCFNYLYLSVCIA